MITSRSGEGRIGQVRLLGRITGGTGIPGRAPRRYRSHALTFVTAGSGSYRDGAHSAPVTAGTLILVFPDRPHWYGAAGGTWDECFVVFGGPLFDLAQRQGVLSPARPVIGNLPVTRWQGRLDAMRVRPRPSTPAGCDAEALELLALLTEATGADSGVRVVGGGAVGGVVDGGSLGGGVGGGSLGGSVGTLDWFASSIELLESDLDRSMPMAEVAAAVGLPYETWRRRFRVAAGVGPHRYRARHRLETAADLLRHSCLSTRDIAAALGYSDERHLIRRFRAFAGLTPRQFRDQLR